MKLRRPMILGIDTGGTMTDTVLVDEKGEFTIGKAQTTPEFEAKGIINSLKNAAEKWNMNVEDVAKSLKIVIYSGTIMLNRILERKGVYPLGIITTAGFEDTLRIGRSRQSWNTLSYAERLHAISHFYPEPLIPRNMIMGVRERILITGNEMIPLYEDEVEEAAKRLIRRGAKGIIIMFLNSWANPVHELRSKEIVEKVIKDTNVNIPVYLSHRIAPVLGELGRLNAVVIHAYAAEVSREQFRKLESEFNSRGYRGTVSIFTNYGTLVPIEYERLVHTISSGPAGGATAVKYLSETYGFDYAVGIDIGGTSFDVSSILAGQPVIDPVTTAERFVTAVPSIRVVSIGAGTGSFVRIDPVTRGVRIGPDSAGYKIGVSWKEGKVKTVTVNDAMVVLGYINPDYFLGGDIKLDREHATKEFEEQIASKLGIDVYEAAWGVYQMVSERMRLHLESTVRSLGLSPENFYLIIYGGGGPLLVASVVNGLKFAGTLIPELAPAFSAYGTTLPDLGIRAEGSVEVYVPPLPEVTPVGIAVDIMKGIAKMLGMEGEVEGMRSLLYANATSRLGEAWKRLEEYVKEEFKRAGIDEEKISWNAAVRMLYAGMLDDVEVSSSTHEASDKLITELCEAFDELFAKVYASSARSREFGYVITRAILTGLVKLTKPKLREYAIIGKEPMADSFKEEREIYWDGKWYNAKIYEMGLLQPGNEIEGPAVIEAPATTLVVPPSTKVILDKRRVFWMSTKDMGSTLEKKVFGGV